MRSTNKAFFYTKLERKGFLHFRLFDPSFTGLHPGE
uniref:Uncharacterized protein n=1 Tax=Anguilla anguilla TaxID=7936 RepID=A0A0E9PGE5_ANGAN